MSNKRNMGKYLLGVLLSLFPCLFFALYDLHLGQFEYLQSFLETGDLVLTAFLITVSTSIDIMGENSKVRAYIIFLLIMALLEVIIYAFLCILENKNIRLCYIESITMLCFSIGMGICAKLGSMRGTENE